MQSEFEFEVARSGRFRALGGKVIELSKKIFREMVETFDLSQHRPRLKLGHPPQDQTQTPAYGFVTGLRYDEEKDRLFAKVKPTDDLAQWIREGRFPERSIEYQPAGANGKARFLHLGFLGASDPAISGLAPALLAAGSEYVAAVADERLPEIASWYQGPVDAAGSRHYLLALEEIASESALGNTIDFAEGARRAAERMAVAS